METIDISVRCEQEARPSAFTAQSIQEIFFLDLFVQLRPPIRQSIIFRMGAILQIELEPALWSIRNR